MTKSGLLALLLCLFDHLCVREDVDLDTAVLSTSFDSGVVSDRLIGTHADGQDARRAHTLCDEVVEDAVRSLLGEGHIVFVTTGAVGVTDDLDVGVRVFVHVLSEACEGIARSRTESA